jgi:hypothetical protein
MMRTFLVIAMVVFTGTAFAQKADRDREGPLGLVWASSKASVEAQGVKLKPISQKDFGESFEATDLPRALSDLQSTVLRLATTTSSGVRH